MGHRKGIAAAGYVLAAAVGASRVANGEHWASDVLAGAGAGLLAVHIAYATHQYRWKLPRWAPRWLEGPQVRAGLVPAPGGIGLRLQW
jgi:membrane-associated phospholipid phosphatase